MNILIVNKSERTGGAAVAANRLMEALNNNGEKAMMLVGEKQTDNISVAGMPHRWLGKWHFLWERLCIFVRLHLSRTNLFAIDIANSGFDITRTPEFRWADVVHLHWINQGMLSLKSIRKIVKSGKPVVWTMHDAWAFTGICHYARGCEAFQTGCHDCPLLPNHGSKHDLSHRVWKKKKLLFDNANISFVACSQWLADQAKQSALLRGQHIVSIPNAIDSHIYCQKDKHEARTQLGLPLDRNIILFVSQRVTDERKGVEYFIEALAMLTKEHPEMVENTAVAILGSHSEEITSRIALPTYPLGYIENESMIVATYNAADLYVLPSMEDNLPNTIMEAMSCGVPCVGFRIGGIPEMIENGTNGYVAEPKNAADLARGIHWTLCEADRKQLSQAAISKVKTTYSQQSVAAKYIEVYSESIAMKKHIK